MEENKNQERQDRFIYEGFGFPVVLLNVPMVKVRGIWTPKTDYNRLARSVLLALAHKPSRLTGHEIRFIRQSFEMTLVEFGNRFDVSHPAVMKWEEAEDDAPPMKWPTEKDMRLFILDRLGVRNEVPSLYHDLEHIPSATVKPVEVGVAVISP